MYVDIYKNRDVYPKKESQPEILGLIMSFRITLII